MWQKDASRQSYMQIFWKNSTAEESKNKNKTLSLQRAQSVSTYLISNGATSSQLKYVEGLGEENPVASNATTEGQAQNRRVEVFILPSKAMVEAANAEAAAAKQ